MKKTIIAALAAICSFVCSAQEHLRPEPDVTCLFARRDTCDLYLDIYNPADSLCTGKPTVIFAFGGGFMSGSRDHISYAGWFRTMTDAGYRVVSIDYRLGLKGMKDVRINKKFINALDNAIGVAVEDLFSATSFLIDNATELGIDPGNIVISGSSAGAITAMQAEWEICNGSEAASVLPDGFNYAGVMSFSGAIFSKVGAIRYTRLRPCPTVMFHGDADKMVPYSQIAFLKLRFAGSDVIAKTFAKEGYSYRIYRFAGHGHEIAGTMDRNFSREDDFLRNDVMSGKPAAVDSLIRDSGIEVPDWAAGDFKTIYK